MPKPTHNAITRALEIAGEGDVRAADSLLPLVYEELRRLARARLARETPGSTLQPTALVHEAYLRVVGDDDPGWDNRRHFFGAAAQAMRRILLDQARRKAQLKHGGADARADFDCADVAIEPPADNLLEIDEALQKLEAADPRKREIVNIRYFAGLSNEDTAATLGLSVGTIEREWRFIRVWLRRELGKAESG